MRIADIKCFRLRAPVDEIMGGGSGWVTSRSALFVKVTTDEGLVGWGEAGQTGSTLITSKIIDHVLKPMYLGEDPFTPEVLWEKAYLQTRDYGQKGQIIGAISGLDIALYDIMGKATNRPIHQLLGGAQRDKIVAYATGLWYRLEDDSVEALVEDALRFKEMGFTAMKPKVGFGSVEYDVARIRALREALGPDIGIMVDCNHSLNVSQAIELGRRIEEFYPLWIEEPTIPEDIEGYARIRSMLAIPVAGGECEFTRFGFKNLLVNRAIDIAQPDICGSGGFTELKKIAGMANAFGVPVIPHVWNSIIGVVASIHLIASLPDCPTNAAPKPFRQQPGIEYDRSFNPLRDEFGRGVLNFQNGCLQVVNGAGLGIDLDERDFEPYLDVEDAEVLSVQYGV